MYIKLMEVEGFRGFVSKKVFNISKSKIIILYGPNGHGKTSFFDAIEWGLTGKLYRYDNPNDERNRAKFIANQTSKNTLPKVKLVIDYNESEIVIIRTGENRKDRASDYGRSRLTIMDETGSYVENPDDFLRKLLVNSEWLEKVDVENMNKMYNLTHNLGQEKITHFINDTKDGERYNSLSIMLGTDYFREYETKFKNVRHRIKATIDERNKNIEIINREKIYIDKEIESLLEQMNDHEINEEEVAVLLENFNKLFNLNVTTEKDLEELPKLLNQLDQKEIIKEKKLSQELSGINSVLECLLDVKEKLRHEPHYISKAIKLKDLYNYKNDLVELASLEKQLKQLEDKRKKLSASQEKYKQLTNDLDVKQKEYDNYYNIWNKTKGFIEKAQIDNEFQTALNYIEENITISEYFQLVKSKLLIVSMINIELSSLKEQISLIDKLCVDSQKSMDNISELKNEHNQLLKLTIEYMNNHPHLSSCPVCGTKEIHSTHIIDHMKSVNHDSNFSSLMKKNQEYKKELKEISDKKNTKVIELEDNLNRLSEIISDCDKKIIKEKVEINTLENERKRILQSIEMEEVILVEVNKSLNKFDLPIELETDKLVLKVKDIIMRISSEITEINREYEIDENNSLDYSQNQNDENLKDIKNEKNFLVQSMSSYGYDDIFDLEKFDVFITGKKKKLIDDIKENTNKKEFLIIFQSKINSFKLLNRLNESKIKLDTNNRQCRSVSNDVSELSKDLIIMDKLINSVPKVIDKLNQESLEKLFELVQTIYNKINSHPLYKKVKFDSSQRFNSNKLLLNVLTDDGVESNPTFIYSAAQIRTLAISLFLAMSIKQKWTSLNFICMDDPIQSMDDLNIISFIDLMRILVSQEGLNKQFIISTHNSNFYDMLRKKFRMHDIGLIEYESYGENGPVFVDDSEKFRDEDEVIHKTGDYSENIGNELIQFFNSL